MYTHLKYASILGYGMAGEVAALGKGVTGFKVGGRVLGFSRAADKEINDPAQGAFNDTRSSLKISPALCRIMLILLMRRLCHSACLLGMATAAAAMFDKAQMGLQLPQEPRLSSTDQTVVV